jgi:hypothetical protein
MRSTISNEVQADYFVDKAKNGQEKLETWLRAFTVRRKSRKKKR